MDTLANSLVSLPKTGQAPAFDELLETIAEMFDRMLTPEGGGNLEAGKNVMRQFAADAQKLFEQMELPSKDDSQS